MLNNIPTNILNKIGLDLYKTPNHPIKIVKDIIFDYFENDLEKVEICNPYLSTKFNFDKLRIPNDHSSRKPSDTFYKDDETVLRTHMTGYLYPLASIKPTYIVCGDVYRKDAIDITHYPIFHQIDAFYLVPKNIDVKQDLRMKLTGLIKHLFGKECSYKLLEDVQHKDVYFPFTIDSLEIEVDFPLENGEIKKLEVLGAGTVHPEIMKELGLENKQAWAFGLGLERLAMILFDIPDIRLFWSNDPRFLNQFIDGKITKFKPYSKYEKCYKDVTFFINDAFTYNDFCSIVRDEDKNDVIESISLIDEFSKNKKISHCYRIVYRSMLHTLKNIEIDSIQNSIRKRLINELNLELR